METKKIIYDDYNNRIRADQNTMTTLTTNCGTDALRNGVKIIEQTHIKVKQATRQGYIECELGGVANLCFPKSLTRRGRVIENGNICPTLTTDCVPNVLEKFVYEIDGEKYLVRIRKLTPCECFRFMGFDDTDFDKAAKVNAPRQLYKQAGNSIVVPVVERIIQNLVKAAVLPSVNI